MRYGVLGAGAIGAYLGARLAQSGADVVLVGRGALAEAASREGGVWLQKPFGAKVLVPITMTQDLTRLSAVEVLLVAVRSCDTAQVAGQVSAVLPSTATIFSMQNGVS